MRGRQKNVMCKGQWFFFNILHDCSQIYIWQKRAYFVFFLLLLNSPVNFYRQKKTCVEASWAVFSSMSGYKEDTTLRGLRTLLQMQNSSFWTTGMRRRQNFEIILKVKQQSIEFSFRFLSSPLLSLFLPHFFSCAGYLVGFTWARN